MMEMVHIKTLHYENIINIHKKWINKDTDLAKY